MAFLRSALFITVPSLLAAAPATAQDAAGNGAAPVFTLPPSGARPVGPERQGPEIDVPRDSASPSAGTSASPPVVAPTLTPVPRAATVPAPESPVSAPRTLPSRSAPATVPVPASTPAPQPVPQPVPIAAPPEPAAAPPAATADPAPPASPVFPWLFAALAALATLAGAILLTRRRKRPGPAEAAPDIAPDPALSPTAPAQPSAGLRPKPPIAQPPSERPRIALTLEVQTARLSLAGATIGYALVVENRGTIAAEEVIIRGLITGADASQQAVLAGFLAREAGVPIHALPMIAPGESHRLAGELRIAGGDIVPTQAGDRQLLVPLIGFDADYRWAGEGTGGAGRTARAFVVGQEQDPPTDRLSPLRLDLGPRQFRNPGCRATALDLVR